MNENVFPEWMTRTVQLLGAEKCGLLQKAHVLVAGLGGVGSAAAENMVRAGIGKITLVDNDTVQLTNINRQLPALHSTIGQAKVKVMESRLKDINPELNIITHELFLNEETLDFILEPSFDFVVDSIDTLTPKILFIEKVIKLGVPLASSMGSGGKTDPSKIFITDFRKTYNCRLAYLLRKKLRKLGVHGGFKVVFSTELADKGLVQEVDNEPNKKSVLGTVSYIPVIFGSMLASIVIDGVTDNAS
jgi:tRNA A37 threonylcarbamoyladenosine dehydratase